MIQEKYPELWNKTKTILKTCPSDNTEDGCLTFVKDLIHAERLKFVKHNIDVIVPDWMTFKFPKNITSHSVDDVKRVFIQLHNLINDNKEPEPNVISSSAVIHPTAIIGLPGNNITKMSDGRIINMKHMGNVIIEDCAEVQALSIVHRSVFNSTIIRKNAQVFAKANIGHNCIVGESTIVCPGVLLGGGTKVGKNCYIWQGVITRSNISICDNVIIGAGSLVLKSIHEPGVYFGNPAKYIKPYSEDLR